MVLQNLALERRKMRNVVMEMSRMRSEDWEMINHAHHGDFGDYAMISKVLIWWGKSIPIHCLLHRTDTRDHNFEVRNHSGSQGIGHLQTTNQLVKWKTKSEESIGIFRTIIHDLMCREQVWATLSFSV